MSRHRPTDANDGCPVPFRLQSMAHTPSGVRIETCSAGGLVFPAAMLYPSGCASGRLANWSIAMRARQTRSRLATLLATASAAGILTAAAACQRPLGPIFAKPSPPITWPSDPARARIAYVGSLSSSADLKSPREPFQGIVDLFVGQKPTEQLYGPRSVVTTSGGNRVWIADPGGRCLHLFDLRNREYKKVTHAGEGRMLSPSGLCVGPGETLFVCDAEAVAIHQLSERSGAVTRSLHLAEHLKRPVALCYDHRAEHLFVVDVAAHNVTVLSLDGRLIRVIGRRGAGPGQFNFPCGIANDGETIWIADAGNQRVQGLRHDGDPVITFGRAGDTPGRMALPKAVATDSDGHVYVLDARFENVQVFDRTGNLLLVVGEEGTGPGQFWLPAGIFVDPSDRIWICDMYNRRVQVFDRIKSAPQPAEPHRGSAIKGSATRTRGRQTAADGSDPGGSL